MTHSVVVDLTRDCSRIVIDNWLDVRLTKPLMGQKIVIVVHQLRLMWKNLLLKKLQNENYTSSLFVQSIQVSITRVACLSLVQEMDTVSIADLPPLIAKVVQERDKLSIICDDHELAEKFAQFLEWPIGYTITRLKQSEIMTTVCVCVLLIILPDYSFAKRAISWVQVKTRMIQCNNWKVRDEQHVSDQ